MTYKIIRICTYVIATPYYNRKLFRIEKVRSLKNISQPCLRRISSIQTHDLDNESEANEHQALKAHFMEPEEIKEPETIYETKMSNEKRGVFGSLLDEFSIDLITSKIIIVMPVFVVLTVICFGMIHLVLNSLQRRIH